MLDLRARDRSQLTGLLAHEDTELIDLLGGRRREELRRAHGDGSLTSAGSRASAVCVHDRSYPRRLRVPGAPRLLYTRGNGGLLLESDERPTVAMLGTSRPSNYGAEMARSLACTLAGSGVLVVVPHRDGIARAAREGAERAGCGAIVLGGDGLDTTSTSYAGALAAPGPSHSCLVAELPAGARGRRWGRLAAERTVVHLSDVVVVVECGSAEELFAIELARTSRVRIAAVPGRATSPLSQGPLELLSEGAALVRSARDLAPLLGIDCAAPQVTDRAGLSTALARLLDRVGSGDETLDQLLNGAPTEDVLVGLAELELMGLLRRTRDGRYVATALRLP